MYWIYELDIIKIHKRYVYLFDVKSSRSRIPEPFFFLIQSYITYILD